jgi:hypothetical protein
VVNLSIKHFNISKILLCTNRLSLCVPCCSHIKQYKRFTSVAKKHELTSCILFRRNSVFSGLLTTVCHFLHSSCVQIFIWSLCLQTLTLYYKCYVPVHYPSSCLYVKTPSCLYYKTTFRRLDSVSFRWNLLSWAQSEIGASSIDWAQLSRFYLKTETKFSLRNVFCNRNRRVFLDKGRTIDNIQKYNICTNVQSSQTFRSYLLLIYSILSAKL